MGYRKCWLSISTTSVLSLWSTLSQFPRNDVWRWFHKLRCKSSGQPFTICTGMSINASRLYPRCLIKSQNVMNVNGVIRERRYLINTNTILWQLLFVWDDFKTCQQSKIDKLTAKLGTITSFNLRNLRISTGREGGKNCMSITVSRTGTGPIFVEWA